MSEDNNKIVIDRVYSEMIDLVLSGFEQSEEDQIKKLYSEYLKNKYSEFIQNDSDLEKTTKAMFIMEKSLWTNKSKEYKLSILIKDDFLDQLYDLSNIAYKLAIERKTSSKLTISTEKAKQQIDKMNEISKKVQPFNNEIGYSYLLEGVEDYNYACGNSDEHSLRVGRSL